MQITPHLATYFSYKLQMSTVPLLPFQLGELELVTMLRGVWRWGANEACGVSANGGRRKTTSLAHQLQQLSRRDQAT